MPEPIFELVTDLGPDLLFNRLSGEEPISRLYEYRFELLSAKPDIDPDQVLSKPMALALGLEDESKRYLTGYVTEFSEGGSEGNRFVYYATVHPWLWFLTRTADCRIFQNLTVPAILDAIFVKYPQMKLEKRLTGEYRSWDYCVQYRESDFNFVSRLMEHEGITYFFDHSASGQTLVLADHPTAHQVVPGFEKLNYFPPATVARGTDFIREWRLTKKIHTAKYQARDYNFETPSADLSTRKSGLQKQALADTEVYDYPGGYMVSPPGENYAGVRIEELQVGTQRASGSGNVRALTPGHTFTLDRYPRAAQNAGYLVTRAAYEIQVAGYGAGHDQGARFVVDFDVIPQSTPFRPDRTTRKPFVQGPQTAVVVGSGEIFTDVYGRVKVQFFWDRLGKEDGNSSCWIRVSHPWAGKNFGMIAIPRVGQEVIVDFLEGDPDQPIITGRVYNAQQMPPWELPANATQTGILSRSSTGGSPANANAIRMEDKAGSEQIWIHAEKNQDIEVEHDETHWVGHDRTKTIDHDETTLVKHDRTETVNHDETITIGVDRVEKVGNNETITIGNNRTESVGVNETISIGSNRTETVGANETIGIGANRSISVGASETATVALQRTHTVGINETITVGAAQEITIGGLQAVTIGAVQTVSVGASQTIEVGANMSETVGGRQTSTVGAARTITVDGNDTLTIGKTLVINVADSISITTGDASIHMKKDGTITIKGKDITLQGSGGITVKAEGNITMKGQKILQN